MLYFTIRPLLNFLSNEQRGQLLTAILDYAERGIIPDFDDPLLGMSWVSIASGIDRDGEAYNEKVDKKKYATFCREAQKKDIEPIPFDEWLALDDDQRKQLLLGGII